VTLSATFTVYGTNVDELKEEAYNHAVRFFRTIDDNIKIEELHAVPVIVTQKGEPTRWRATVRMQMEEEDD
jgi:hypothetical protein